MQMKSLKPKLFLSALGIVAMLMSPAFAQTRHYGSYVNQSAVTAPIPGYQSTVTAPLPSYQSAVTAPIPGYDKDGGVVGISNPDQPY
jgi:hypothetical protein